MVASMYLYVDAVRAVLEHEAIPGLSAGKPTGLRQGRAHRGSVSEDKNKDMSLDMLIKAVCAAVIIIWPCQMLEVRNATLDDPGISHSVRRGWAVCARMAVQICLGWDVGVVGPVKHYIRWGFHSTWQGGGGLMWPLPNYIGHFLYCLTGVDCWRVLSAEYCLYSYRLVKLF